MFRRRADRRAATNRFVQVECLDSSQFQIVLEKRLTGNGLLESVCHSMGIREVGFFGLVCKQPEDNQDIWLDTNKLVRKQLNGVPPYLLHLVIKVYPINSTAVDEATRNYLYQQVKSDIKSGRLRCENPANFSKMVAFLAQGELGDINPSTSLSELMLPNLNTQILSQATDVYSQLKGKTLMACREELLRLAQQEDTYGMIVYQVLDCTRRPVNLGLAPSGIRVMHGTIPTAIYRWNSVLKIYTKHKTVNVKICSVHTRVTQKAKFHCPHLNDTKLLARTIAEMVGYYREHGRSPETLPRFKRFFTGRNSNRRIQRSLSLRVHSSSKLQPSTSGVRSFATQSFSGADIARVPKPVTSDKEITPIGLMAERSYSASSTPAVNGRLLHETGQTLDESYCVPGGSKRGSAHSGEANFPENSSLLQDGEDLKWKNSPAHSIDRLTDKTEASLSFDISSREYSPHAPPLTEVTMETAQVETFLGSLDIHPRNSTPQQTTRNNVQLDNHCNGTPLQGAPIWGTPLHIIPEKTKSNFPVSGSPGNKAKSSPMLRGSRFCSESSIQRQLRATNHSPECSPSIVYRHKRGRGSITSEVTNSLLLNRPSSSMMPEAPCDEAYLDSHIRSILFDASQREETSTEF